MTTLSGRNGYKPSVTEGVPGKIRNRACPHDHEGLEDGAGTAAPGVDSGSSSKRARLATWRNQAWGHVAGYGRVLRDARPYTACPVSIRDAVAYTRAGGWMPGDHGWWLESLGYTWGVIIAIPVTITGNSALFVLQRPLRATGAGLVWISLWWAGVVIAPSWALFFQVWAALAVVSIVLALTHPKKSGSAP